MFIEAVPHPSCWHVQPERFAGIALAHRATLATRNVRHFQNLTVPVVNPRQAGIGRS
jgi:hypothetical protein